MKVNTNPGYAGHGATLKVGDSTYSIPGDAVVQMVTKKTGGELAWVRDADGSLYLFTQAGQVTGLSDRIRSHVLAEYFLKGETPPN